MRFKEEHIAKRNLKIKAELNPQTKEKILRKCVKKNRRECNKNFK